MKYLYLIYLALFYILVIPSSVWASGSIGYIAGRAATLIDEDCGRYDLSQKLYDRFSNHKDYNKGETSGIETSSQPSAVNTTDCSALERRITQLLSTSEAMTVVSSNSNGSLSDGVFIHKNKLLFCRMA